MVPPTTSAPIFQHSTLKREPASAALGALPSPGETEDPFRPEGMDSAILTPMATPTQTSLQVATPGDIPSLPHITHSPSQLTMLKTLEVASISFISQPQASPGSDQQRLSDELLQLQEQMNVAQECLITNRATMDSCHRELELNIELMACLNEAQAIKAIKEAEVHHATAIKEAKVHHATTACVFQQTHRESVLMWEHEAKVEEGWDCQAFMEAFQVAIQACPPENWGAFLYPLQLLTGDAPPAALPGMLATAQLQVVANGGLMPAASMLSVLETPALLMGAKCQCHSSDQGVPMPRLEEEEMMELADTVEE